MTTSNDIDIHELLARSRQIAIVWSVYDVQSVRSDLTADQAWMVLTSCRRRHDCNFGITWDLIEYVADEIYPMPTGDVGVSS